MYPAPADKRWDPEIAHNGTGVGVGVGVGDGVGVGQYLLSREHAWLADQSPSFPRLFSAIARLLYASA